MSRLGKKPILIPAGVFININGSSIAVKGPKGDLTLVIRPEIKVEVADNVANVSVIKDTKETSAYYGLTRTLLDNMVKGVTQGYEKKLELIGVGYRAKAISGGVSLAVGYSHPVEFKAPVGIDIIVEDTQNVVIRGADKQLVGAVAANIRKIRKPEPYKGKGIKYSTEVVRRKVGKSGKV